MNNRIKVSLLALSAFGLLGTVAHTSQAQGRQPETSAANQTTTTPTSNPNVERSNTGVTGRTDTHTGTYGNPVNTDRPNANRSGTQGRSNTGSTWNTGTGAAGGVGTTGSGNGASGTPGTGAGAGAGAGVGASGAGGGR